MDISAVYCKNNYLVIENNFMLEKIDSKSFDDIIIFHEYPTRKYKIFMFFTNPVQYEPQKGFINKIICSIFNHNNNPYEIKRVYYDHDIEVLLPILKQCLPDAQIPDLKNSLFWRTEEDKNSVPKTKLVYSKDKLSLTDVFRKHKMMK
ncbi:hypothetical protein A0O34_00315 [Chryseobacterium glaciei]|uniref:Uncharacterized protein n=2 Tax=Chryseobacterium glaciei TaxID=1685010 RepID=A0A172XQH6_9FLAO|nr:hypothetical protein A0O34_00315 [Chryseobacterium glaciei]